MTFEQRSLNSLVASRCAARSSRRVAVGSTATTARLKSVARIFVCVVVATLMAHAQGVGTSGEITGTVADPSGSVLLKSTVTVVDTQTGFKRTATTDSTGQFRVAGLSPATYDVTAEMQGFATAIRRGVTVAVGQTVNA